MLTKSFISLIAFTCVAAQGSLAPSIQPKCAGNGTVDANDCNLALEQFNRNGTFITQEVPKNSSSCSSCQLILVSDSPGCTNFTIPTDCVKQGLQSILDSCHCGYGMIQLPPVTGNPNEPVIKLAVIGGNGNVCYTSNTTLPNSQPEPEPESGSAIKLGLKGIFSVVLFIPTLFFYYFA
ncbi:hypothetical protein CROQUDRAFT_110461 [Cronartium quercuum f. sp. fusiforme G11]|uniref:Uncharacterized protein n=1 Tax=Cronartium quercuum f. sp. fusiforme G11 TaxID=708437 RepID=A0A9P6T6X6_9BASI|nr:hypothetical protein CROQUDRAFT_110461 [Cronartium quercuum f. sp. fusiforme G11]